MTTHPRNPAQLDPAGNAVTYVANIINITNISLAAIVLPATMQALLSHPLSPDKLGAALALAALTAVAMATVVTAVIRAGLRAWQQRPTTRKTATGCLP